MIPTNPTAGAASTKAATATENRNPNRAADGATTSATDGATTSAANAGKKCHLTESGHNYRAGDPIPFDQRPEITFEKLGEIVTEATKKTYLDRGEGPAQQTALFIFAVCGFIQSLHFHRKDSAALLFDMVRVYLATERRQEKREKAWHLFQNLMEMFMLILDEQDLFRASFEIDTELDGNYKLLL